MFRYYGVYQGGSSEGTTEYFIIKKNAQKKYVSLVQQCSAPLIRLLEFHLINPRSFRLQVLIRPNFTNGIMAEHIELTKQKNVKCFCIERNK